MIDNNQPKPLITRKMFTRGAVAVVVAVALFAAISALRRAKDIDLGTKDTVGWVAAIQETDTGEQAVLISDDGTVLRSPDWTEGARDRDIVWRPDGNRLFFASDRAGGETHMYRWNPASNRVDRRTVDAGSYSHPAFARTGEDDTTMLVAKGGRVVEFDPTEGTAKSVLPPSARAVSMNTGETEGAMSSFDALYSRIGNSFREARWVKGKRWVAAVMRTDTGEALILQSLELANGDVRPPLVVAEGDRIEFDVNAKTGQVVFANMGFKFAGDPPPAYIKDGKVVPTIKHALGIIDPDNPGSQPDFFAPARIILASNSEGTMASPALSPDGSTVVFVAGRYREHGDMERAGLWTVPAREGAARAATSLWEGPARNPRWGPSGQEIVFSVRRATGGEIHLIKKDGSGDRVLAQGKGSFINPRISPQTPTDQRSARR